MAPNPTKFEQTNENPEVQFLPEIFFQIHTNWTKQGLVGNRNIGLKLRKRPRYLPKFNF